MALGRHLLDVRAGAGPAAYERCTLDVENCTLDEDY
jgi:hypothetical protein